MIVDTTKKNEHTPVRGCPGLFHTDCGMGVLAERHAINGVRYIGRDKCCCQDSLMPGLCTICHGIPFGSTDEDWIKFKQQNPDKYCSQAVWHGFKFHARHNFWEAYGSCNTIECWKCSAINYLSPYMFHDGHDSHDRWCVECSSDLFPNCRGEGSWETIVTLGASFPRRLIKSEVPIPEKLMKVSITKKNSHHKVLTCMVCNEVVYLDMQAVGAYECVCGRRIGGVYQKKDGSAFIGVNMSFSGPQALRYLTREIGECLAAGGER